MAYDKIRELAQQLMDTAQELLNACEGEEMDEGDMSMPSGDMAPAPKKDKSMAIAAIRKGMMK